MKQNPTTQWANAGLSPSPEAIRDHLLIGLLQEGSPIPEDYPELLSDSGIVFAGSWFGLAQIHVVAVDAYAYIRGLGQTSYSEAHLVVNLLELFRELFSRDQHPTVDWFIQLHIIGCLGSTPALAVQILSTEGVLVLIVLG